MRGHALFDHHRGYDALSDSLVPLTPEELGRQCEAYRRGQMNSVQRRALAARVVSGGGSPGAAGSGPGVLGGPPPDLSGGQVPDDLGSEPGISFGDSDDDIDPEPDLPAQTAAVAYPPPRGMSPDEMSDYITDVVPMRRPSAVAALLAGPTPDPAAAYWLQVVAHLQRRMAATLHSVIDNASAAGGDDRHLLNSAAQVVARWVHRPLDDDLED